VGECARETVRVSSLVGMGSLCNSLDEYGTYSKCWGGGGVRERDRAKKSERDERVQGDRLTYRRTLTE
jgi:hypothetical protein